MITSHGLAQRMYDHRPREPFYAVLDLDVVDEDDTILAPAARHSRIAGPFPADTVFVGYEGRPGTGPPRAG